MEGRPAWFTIPTRECEFRRPDRYELESLRGLWREKMLRRFQQSYAHAPFREPVLEMVRRVLATPSPFVADLAVASLEAVRDYLGYTTPIHRARNRYEESDARGQDRVIAICRAEGATEYLNAMGGSALYDRQTFEKAGIALRFVRGAPEASVDSNDRSAPALSILDTLMHNSIAQVRTLVAAYELV